MNRFSLRLNIFVYAMCILALSFIIVMSPHIPNTVGIVQFQSISGEGLYYHYSDYDTGLRIHTTMPVANTNFAEFPQVNSNSLEQTVSIVSFGSFGEDEGDIIGTYPAEPVFDWTVWYERNRSVLVVYTENARTGLAIIDIATGELTPFLSIDDFNAGLISLSPDGNYLLLRETETNFTASSPPQPNWLVNLRTAEVVDLGDLVYAYWSPDSRKLAFGQPAETRLQSTVEIYDISTGAISTLDITIAQGDTSFFTDSINAFVNAVLWSPDSQTLMIHNRAMRQLQHIDLSGIVLSVYEGGRLLPKLWSPNGRYLLAVGYDEEVAGAFIVDTQNQTRSVVNSEVVIQDSLADFAWSQDSRHIAVMTRTSGTNQVLQLAIYNLNGQAVVRPNIVETAGERSFVLRNSLQWIH